MGGVTVIYVHVTCMYTCMHASIYHTRMFTCMREIFRKDGSITGTCFVLYELFCHGTVLHRVICDLFRTEEQIYISRDVELYNNRF